MKKAEDIKERIIKITIELIQSSSGDVAEITTREIAQRANIGNGLINYHFQTKENLIKICVKRIINQVIDNFKPQLSNIQNPQEKMICVASAVFEFLFSNPAISRISILSDFSEPTADSNTVKSQQHICGVMEKSLKEEDKKIFSFILATAMQAAFLANSCGDTMTGHKLDTPNSRKDFIKKLVDTLFNGINTEEIKNKI